MRFWSKGESMQAIVQLFFIVTTKSEACWSIIVGQNPLFISTSLLCPQSLQGPKLNLSRVNFFSRSSPLLLRITQFRSPLPFCRIENTNASLYKSNSHPQIPTPIKHTLSLMDYYEILEHVVSFVTISSLFFKAMNIPETQSFHYLVKQCLWCKTWRSPPLHMGDNSF